MMGEQLLNDLIGLLVGFPLFGLGIMFLDAVFQTVWLTILGACTFVASFTGLTVLAAIAYDQEKNASH